MFNRLIDAITVTATREVEVVAKNMELTNKNALFAELAGHFANLQVTHTATAQELHQTREELHTCVDLDISNEMKTNALQAQAQAQSQEQGAVEEDPDEVEGILRMERCLHWTVHFLLPVALIR